MAFLKKHYEKILLGVMLAGLIGVLVFMLFFIAQDTNEMEQKRTSLTNPRVVALTNLDTAGWDVTIARLKSPYRLDFETTNKLLNPMEWQRSLDNNLIRAARTGPEAVVVTNITPLYLIVSLDSVTTNELGARYIFKVERQAAATLPKRRPTMHYVSMGDKANDVFELRSIKGPAENPESLTLRLVDSNDSISISKDHPYRRVDGYMADFRYDPERKVFKGRRANDRVSFGGVDYSVVEVNQNELILMDQSNQKKTSLPFVP